MPPRAKLNVKPKTARSTIKASPKAASATPTPKVTSTTAPASSLKTVDLKTLLALIGSPTTGNKPTLVSRLRYDVATPKLAPAVQRASGPVVQRVVSVDMGIRNLAFCVADVEIHESSQKQDKRKCKSKDKTSTGPEVKLSIVAWERIAVQELRATDGDEGAGKDEEEGAAAPEKESFLPAALSRIAYTLLTRKLLPHAPGTLLIEQQRYRSQGSSAVQEWTYRVNMLEGMLWAVMETLKAEEYKVSMDRLVSSSAIGNATSTATTTSLMPLPSPHAVSPQRVANFWMTSTPLGRALMAAKKPRGRSGRHKIEKRDKISFLSGWLARSNGSDAVAIPSVVDAIMGDEEGALRSFLQNDVDMSFKTPAAAATRDAFLDKMVGKARGRRKRKPAADMAKEDGLNHSVDKNSSLASTATTAVHTGDDEGYPSTDRPISQATGEQQEAAAGAAEAQQRHFGSTRTEAVQADREYATSRQEEEERHARNSRAAGTKIRQGPGQGPGQGQGQQEHGSRRLEHDDPAHDLGAQASAHASLNNPSNATAASITQERDIGKLDDLADCLLQAAAWARWEGNRQAVEGLMKDGGDHGDGDEEALRQFAAACARGTGEV